MKISRIFEKAKSHLSKEHLQGICYAVEDAVGHKSAERAKQIISQRLNGWAYAPTWLASTILHGSAVHPNNVTDKQLAEIRAWRQKQKDKDIQAWRHAWLDQLIAEFKEKEKSQCKSRTTATSK